MATRISISVPAKINLHLRVLARRRDGYHELSTLFQSIDLFDDLTVEPAPAGEVSLEVDPPGAISSDEENLVIRAARALLDEMDINRGAALGLHKRIPIGGGLGGGSADAAAALVLLDRWWKCGSDAGTLNRLAAGLGSDVPFFLHGGLAHGTGRGDEVSPLPDLGPFHVVLAVPEIRISTPEVYGLVDERLTSNRQEGTVYAFVAGLRRRPEWRMLTNELEEIVADGWPEVGEGLRMLRSSDPLHASLSGSGAAIYAIFDDPETAHRSAERLPQSWFVHIGSTLRRRRAALEVNVE